jgi:hypothetical protein
LWEISRIFWKIFFIGGRGGQLGEFYRAGFYARWELWVEPVESSRTPRIIAVGLGEQYPARPAGGVVVGADCEAVEYLALGIGEADA